MADASILIAEDDLFLQQIYVKSLKEAGYAVTVVPDGRQALDKLAQGGWDLLLLDLKLPELSGIEVLEEMRKNATLKDVPVLVLTNFAEDEYGEKCRQLGVEGFFTKSNLSFEMILANIRKILSGKLGGAKAKAVATPAEPAAPKPAPAPDAPADGKEPTKILVVEDDPFLLQIYKQNLQERHYDVVGVTTGREALQRLSSEGGWRMILLDLLMPEMDGFSVLEELRARGISQNVPVMVLTNLSQENDQKKALEMGAVDFAIKSELSFDEIVARVENVLKKKGGKPPAPARS